MSLAKQIISIPMQAGLDLENAAALVENSRFLGLTNAVFDKDSLGQLHKRPGYNQDPGVIAGGGTLPAVTSLSVFNDELGCIAGQRYLGKSTTLQTWQPRGNLTQLQFVETNIAAGSGPITNSDVASFAGRAYYAYEMNGSSFVKIIDEANKSVLNTINLQAVIGHPVLSPKILAGAGSNALVLCTDGLGLGNLWAVVITIASAIPTKLLSGLLQITSAGEACFDAAIFGGDLFVAAAVTSGGNNLVAYSFNASTLAAIGNVVVGALTVPCPIAAVNQGGNLAIVYQANSGGQLQFARFTTSLVQLGATQAFGPLASTLCPRMAACAWTSGSTYVACLWEQSPVSPQVLPTINLTLLQSGPVYTTVYGTSTNLASQPFIVGSSLFAMTVFPSVDQQTAFLMSTPLAVTAPPVASIAGKFYSNNNAGSPPSNFRMAGAPMPTGTSAILPVLNGPPTLPDTLAELALTFGTPAVESAQLGHNLHLALGGQLYGYDGTALVEHGFPVYPEAPTATLLTSWLTIITDSYDPTDSGIQATFRLAIGDNPTTPGGPVGQLITPGEYITFLGSSNPFGGPASIVWFSVNGVGSAPAGTGIGALQINITSGMTAIQVATTIAAALATAYSPGEYLVTYAPTTQTTAWTPQYISIAGPQVASTYSGGMPPVLNRVSTAAQVYVGNGVAAKSIVGISTPPANLISSGQYGAFAALNATGGIVQTYFWFSNPQNPTTGNESLNGGDPMPFGPLGGAPGITGGYPVTWALASGGGVQYIGVEVTLLGNENATQVATKVTQALQAVQANISGIIGGTFASPYAVTFAASSVSNVVTVQSPQTAGVPTITTAYYPTTTIGQGYVGQVVNNQTGLVAIEYESVYEWTDSQNQLHESAPSSPTVAYFPGYQAVGGGSIPVLSPVPVSAVIQLGIDPISLTQKTSALGYPDIRIANYRTLSSAQEGSQVFYRINAIPSALLNVATQTTPILFADYTSDTAVQSNELLYTTGGVIDNDAPPACNYVINHQNRLWLAGLEYPNQLWYSETWEDGFSVDFSNLQTILLNQAVGQVVGGPITGLASMDGNLIVFQLNQVWYIQGNGPDPTGTIGGFSPPEIVASSSQVGCRDPNSIVLTPRGVMFKSTQGFYLLNRALQLEYIGAPVKLFNSDVVSSAWALTANSQINFLSQSGTTLVYDWFYDSWGTFANHQGLDSLNDGSGVFNYLTDTGKIWTQTPGTFIDGDGTGIPMTIQTAWLKLSDVQGFRRIWKAFFEGNFFGSQPYQVQIAYNYNPTVVDTFTLNAAAGSGQGVWGGDVTWGASPFWGVDAGVTLPNLIQFRCFPSQQPCESIQFTITDLAPYPTNGTWALNAIDLELGVRKGGFKKIGPSASIG